MIEDFPELLGPLSIMSDAQILRFWAICPQPSTASSWWLNGGVGPPTLVTAHSRQVVNARWQNGGVGPVT
jgi:hypothetical protein